MLATGKRIKASLKAVYVPLLLLGAPIPTAMAQSPGTFTATGNMATPRAGHTATLLTNGKVLIAGGGGFVGGGSAEIYDPSTGTFAITGEMISPRSGHTATLLTDGRVLIAGGSGIGSKELASAELYDPASGTFTATNESILSCLSGATLLTNGKVLVTGGLSCPFVPFAPVQPFNLAELYDPSTGAFTRAENMIWDHVASNAALLPDGSVLIAESRSDWWGVGPVVHVGGAERYDPGSGTFRPTGDMTSGVIWAPSTLLLNGKVLFAGGDDSNTSSGYATAQVYDSSTGTFSVIGNMTTGRFGHTQTLLPDGSVLIAGSQRTGTDGGSALASAEVYDPANDAFVATGSMISPRYKHAATVLLDGTVLITGGTANGNGSPGARAEIYHPPVLVPAPVLLSIDRDGREQGAILHASTSQVVSPSDPAIAGEALEIYNTGLIDGGAIPPQVAIDGRMAEILFFGKAPGYDNLNQINVRVPNGIAPGDAIPVRLMYLGRPSNEVTIAVR